MNSQLLIYDDADPVAAGHHSEYIEHLIEYWLRLPVEGRLDIATAPEFRERYDRLHQLLKEGERAGVCFRPLKGSRAVRKAGTVSRSIAAGRLLKESVEKVRPSACLLMSFDHFQASLATGLRFDFPVKLAGIYFRPTFHYGQFEGTRLGLGDRVRQLRQLVMLSFAIRNPHLSSILCLDPYSVPFIHRLRSNLRVFPLPDPLKPLNESHDAREVRRSLGLEGETKVLLLFGALARRKGVFQLLEAAQALPDSVASKACLLLAGPIPASDRSEVNSCCEKVRSGKGVRVITIDRWIDDPEARRLFSIADVVLLPYQRHSGMSAVLVRAASARVPVVGSDYGLLGELIRRRRLGIATDCQDPEKISSAIVSSLSRPRTEFFDAEQARCFAEENSAEEYAKVVFSQVLD